MEQELFNLLMNVPQTIGAFSNWLMSPIYAPYINVSPITLLSVGGVTAVIWLIAIHVVRLVL